MFVCSNTKISCSSSIIKRWIRSIPNNVQKMVFEFFNVRQNGVRPILIYKLQINGLDLQILKYSHSVSNMKHSESWWQPLNLEK